MELVGAYSTHSRTTADLTDLRIRIDNSLPRTDVRRVRREKAPRRLNREEVDDLVQAYRNGLSVYELAAKYRIHRQTASSILEAQGVPRRRKSLSPTQIETATMLRENGWSLAQVGAELGCDPSTDWRTLARSRKVAPPGG